MGVTGLEERPRDNHGALLMDPVSLPLFMVERGLLHEEIQALTTLSQKEIWMSHSLNVKCFRKGLFCLYFLFYEWYKMYKEWFLKSLCQEP